MPPDPGSGEDRPAPAPTHPPPSSPRTAAPGQAEAQPEKASGAQLLTLSIAALGVVYGDIGTSPLYAVRECFAGHAPLAVSSANVLGVLSLMLWSLVLVVSVKYLGLILRAHNHGEGGILALMALVLKSKHRRGVEFGVLGAGIFGAALLYGDGIITPAISVLSAIEGIAIFQPALAPFVIPITLGILVGLFVIQKKGTGGVGAVFGPITFAWFVTLAVLGIRAIAERPVVLASVSPVYAVRFFIENGGHGFLVLGAVFLVVTGSEALYADMGHFGARPIRLTWFAVALPGLVLNYLGQGALLLSDPATVQNPFYRLAPSWALLPLVGLATAAACIASQAVISGAFSLTRQAVQLGFSPRMEIVHTSPMHIGQIYVPAVNWALLFSIIALVVGFQTSSALAAAYGIAVSSTMAITTLLAFLVAMRVWKWRTSAAVALFGIFFAVDLAFLSANAVKFLEGGWFPMVLGAAIFVLMTTWRRGRSILAERLRQATLPLDLLLQNVIANPPHRVPGTAVFMTGNPEGTPAALIHNLKHNKVLHQRVVLLTIETPEVPRVAAEQRCDVEDLEEGFRRVLVRYGFMETPSVPGLLSDLQKRGLSLRMMDTSFFLGRETVIASGKRGMATWRKVLFAWMSKNAQSATAYFEIPPNRVVELGAQVEL
jgi:KUP system potassium uptake protein